MPQNENHGQSAIGFKPFYDKIALLTLNNGVFAMGLIDEETKRSIDKQIGLN